MSNLFGGILGGASAAPAQSAGVAVYDPKTGKNDLQWSPGGSAPSNQIFSGGTLSSTTSQKSNGLGWSDIVDGLERQFSLKRVDQLFENPGKFFSDETSNKFNQVVGPIALNFVPFVGPFLAAGARAAQTAHADRHNDDQLSSAFGAGAISLLGSYGGIGGFGASANPAAGVTTA